MTVQPSKCNKEYITTVVQVDFQTTGDLMETSCSTELENNIWKDYLIIVWVKKKWQIVFSVSLILSCCLVQVWCQSGSLEELSLFAVWSLLTSATSPPPASALSGSPRRRALAASTSCKYTNTHESVFV